MWHKWRSGTFYYGQSDLFDRLSGWMKGAGYVWAPYLPKPRKRTPQKGIRKGWVNRNRLSAQELARAEQLAPLIKPQKSKWKGKAWNGQCKKLWESFEKPNI